MLIFKKKTEKKGNILYFINTIGRYVSSVESCDRFLLVVTITSPKLAVALAYELAAAFIFIN
jgi:hypothetical protein